MQCWYFGNYPSLMSKAAGELSFMEDFSDKQAFLEHLAGIYYGSKAKAAVKAWQCFDEGYRNYPVNIMFSYYGPMHDGVVWDLALKPRNTSLSRTWQLLDPPDGDRIGECLQSGHSLDEAVLLAKRMKDSWHMGMACLPENAPGEQRSVAASLQLLLSSGYNILRFYQLRSRLLQDTEKALAILQEMEAIVDEEICNSEKMIPLCKADSRLGYHSEAEGYKFFLEKLQDRIEKLQTLKKTEFLAAHGRLAMGEKAICWQPEQGSVVYQLADSTENAVWEPVCDNGFFRAACNEDMLAIELRGGSEYKLYFEFEPMWPAPGICLRNEQLELAGWALTHQSVFGEKIAQELDKYQLRMKDDGSCLLTVSREKAGWTENTPIRMFVAIDGQSWVKDDDPVHTLGKADCSPLEFGWLV